MMPVVDLAQILRQIDAGILGDVMQRRQRGHHAGDKIGSRGFAGAILAATFPDRDVVDLQVRDRLDLFGHQLRHLFGDHQQRGQLRIAASRIDQRLDAFGLLQQDRPDAGAFGFHHEPDAVSLALLDPADLLGIGFGNCLDPLFLDLRRDDDVGGLGRPFTLGTLAFGIFFGRIRFLQGLGRFDLFGGDGQTGGLSLLFAAGSA